MSPLIGVILILFIVAILIVYMYNWLLREKEYDNTIDKGIRVVFDRHNILNCDTILVPCVNNTQCRDNCQNGTMTHCSETGYCARGSSVIMQQEDECDASLGMFRVFTTIGNLGTQTICLSLYRDVIDDNAQLRSYVCENGSMSIDLVNEPFDAHNCQCDMGFTRFLYNSGSFTRTIPVCIPNELVNIYSRIYRR
ncbi:pif-3 [Cnaphalocrocis medinalis granulovirus]|uniref:Pif-3 n=3 Tax=Cnaphalocrocis medinalis granulovirus TaxID=1750712 RepID=A0A120L1G6_9BBAC|nr:pif-3 [Cnaphalocrocis medinalis granulovirus]AMF83794.1 pif-3 [Cnaphalocrocis medinalis granulovirus]